MEAEALKETDVTWQRPVGEDKIAQIRVRVVEIEQLKGGTWAATVKGAEGSLAAGGATREEAVSEAHTLILERADAAIKRGESLRSWVDDVPCGVFQVVAVEVTREEEEPVPMFGPWATTQAPLFAHA